jgi:hypothetical protein
MGVAPLYLSRELIQIKGAIMVMDDIPLFR